MDDEDYHIGLRPAQDGELRYFPLTIPDGRRKDLEKMITFLLLVYHPLARPRFDDDRLIGVVCTRDTFLHMLGTADSYAREHARARIDAATPRR